MNAAQHAAMLESGRVRISVTQKDIERGVPGSKQFCPIARAACRVFRETKKRIIVNPKKIGYPLNDAYYLCDPVYEYILPERITTWIKRYDNHMPVKPFRFVTLGRRKTNFGKRYYKEPQ